MGSYFLVSLFFGIIFTLANIRADIIKNNKLTINVPVVFATHTIIGIPMLSVFMLVELFKQLRGD